MDINFPQGESRTVLSASKRNVSTRVVIAELDGEELLLKISTMFSSGRKVYASTIGNTRSVKVEGGTVETWSPLDDKRVDSIPAGARFSQKALLAAHERAIALVKATERPEIAAFFAGAAAVA